MFEFFDPKGNLRIQSGNLPHWFQPGVTYFITFRTDDSVPQPLVRRWLHGRSQWLGENGFDPRSHAWHARLRKDPVKQHEFHKLFSREFMEYLDRGYGRCLLREPELAEIVADTLRCVDGDRYHLGDFVVMPNHIHLLACLLGATEIEAQCEAWKTVSARRINKAVGRSGRFWQEESFDHLVRGPEQFVRFQKYIAENPAKAGLRSGQFLHSALPMHGTGTVPAT